MASDDELTSSDEIDVSAACPYLGLVDDPDSHATYATDAHRCYRLPNPTRIAAHHQDTLCLTDNHISCRVYQGEAVSQSRPTQPARPSASQRPAAGRGLPGAGTTKRPPQQQRPVRPRTEGGALTPRPRSGGIPIQVMAIGAAVLAVVILALAFWLSGLGGDGSGGLSPAETLQTQTALKTQASGPSPTAAASVAVRTGTPGTPSGSPSAVSSGTPGPTRTASPTSGSRAYTVVSGDTCFGIATANNVDFNAFMNLNQLDEQKCQQLSVGQILRLP